MGFDIWGNDLASGHCEVHPWIHCEWPCPECFRQEEERLAHLDAEKAYYDEMQEEMYKEHCHEMACRDAEFEAMEAARLRHYAAD